jgi:hypothetical protein
MMILQGRASISTHTGNTGDAHTSSYFDGEDDDRDDATMMTMTL